MNTFPKLIKVPSRSPRLSYFRHEITATESLFGRWSRYCGQHSLSGTEVDQALAPFRGSGKLLKPAVGTPSPMPFLPGVLRSGVEDRLCDLLGLTPEELACASGAIVGSRQLFLRAFSTVLRWCPGCMALGFHSVVFQHRAVAMCPYHGLDLIEVCPRCHYQQDPTYNSVARAPFTCTVCCSHWLPAGQPVRERDDLRVIGAMLEDRAHELGISTDPPRNIVARSTRCESVIGGPRRVARTSARGLVWPLNANSRWPRFATSAALLNDWQADASAGPRGTEQADAVRDSLRWLEYVCDCVDESRIVRYPAFGKSAKLYDPIPGRISVATVALHMTVVQFARETRVDAGAADLTTVNRIYGDVVWNGVQRGSPLFESPSGNALLLRAEILTYFTVALLGMLHHDYMRPIDWEGDADDRRATAVNWAVELGREGHVLYFRPRATTESVKRLLRRYQNVMLEAWPDFISVGGARNRWPRMFRSMFDGLAYRFQYPRPSTMEGGPGVTRA